MISVVTCIFDQDERRFEACARSVASQSGNWEWVLVDDCSGPRFRRNYQRVLNRFTHNQQRIFWITLDKNVGLSRARNLGLNAARGEWIVVLDSDDELAEGALEIVTGHGKRASLIALASEYVTERGVERRTMGLWAELFEQYGTTELDPFLWFDFYYHGIVAKRALLTAIGGYRAELDVGEDQDILLRACETAGKEAVLFLDELGYRYHENPRGVCATRWPEVEHNYAITMTEAARRRGADLAACRLGRAREINGARIDEYEYLFRERWHRWEDYNGSV